MPRRIYERYVPGDRVELLFTGLGEEKWQTAIVTRREPPGIWARTTDDRDWFVTNTYRIRPLAAPSDPDA